MHPYNLVPSFEHDILSNNIKFSLHFAAFLHYFSVILFVYLILKKATKNLLEIYLKLTSCLILLSQCGEYIWLNTNIRNDLKKRPDCTKCLAKLMFDFEVNSEQKENSNSLFSALNCSQSGKKEFQFTPRLVSGSNQSNLT